MTMTERHFAIIEILDKRRNESISNLAFAFNVSTRTIRTDIELLSLLFPIYTKPGIHGGVFLMEGFSLNKRYLSEQQRQTLERILDNIDEESKYIVKGIIKEFRRPSVDAV